MARKDWRGYLAENAHVSTLIPLWGVVLIEMIGDLMTQSGATQDQVAAVAQAIEANTTAWQTWASNVQTILTNVETALTNAQHANPAIDLTAVNTALSAAQTAVAGLPVETDPTVPPSA